MRSASVFVMILFYQSYQVYILFYLILCHWRTPLPRKPKRAIDLTTEEAIKRLFPKKVVAKLKEIAHRKDSKSASSIK
jgi:hypothetical protein